MPKSRRKKKRQKRVLALPDLEQAKSAVLNTLSSKSGQRTHDHATFFCRGQPEPVFCAVYCLESISFQRRSFIP